MGANSAAEFLIVFGDNPERIRSEAAFAKLCGACPIPASSGRTTGRHRLYRGRHRQANAALYRSVIVRMRCGYHGRRPAKREIIRCDVSSGARSTRSPQTSEARRTLHTRT